MRMMAMNTVAVVFKVPMEQAEAQALADIKTVSEAAAAGEITVPHGRGASHHVLIADHKPRPLHLGLPRSPLSSPAKMKVGHKTI